MLETPLHGLLSLRRASFWWRLRRLGGARDIRVTDEAGLLQLIENSYSGSGRDQYLADHAGRIDTVIIWIMLLNKGVMPETAFRSQIVVILKDGGARWFYIDLKPRAYLSLRRLTRWELTRLTIWLVDHHVPWQPTDESAREKRRNSQPEIGI